MREVWKKIQKYEDRYEVSNLGRVRSVIKGRAGPVYLKPRDNGKGYKTVYLYDSKAQTAHVYIHRLVAFTFVANYFKRAEVNHLDGNKANNVSTNLKFMSHSANLRHAYDTKLHHGPTPVNRRRVVCESDEGVEAFESIKEGALKVGVSPCGVSNAIKGNQKTAAGRIWRYV